MSLKHLKPQSRTRNPHYPYYILALSRTVLLDNLFQNSFIVFVIDLGSYACVAHALFYQINHFCNVSRLRGFPSELLDLPVQSTRCFLADVRPPDATDEPMMDDECWPVSTMEALIQLVAGKKLVAKMLVSDGG